MISNSSQPSVRPRFSLSFSVEVTFTRAVCCFFFDHFLRADGMLVISVSQFSGPLVLCTGGGN